ncbi:MAG TPA: hypothetical protein VKR38_12315 [Usitatibacter sp.]|nr:hypothetical protein [Usitatibacter sp.]
MTAKQQIATGFLAALIICSVAFMPATADTGSHAVKTIKRATPVVATQAGAAQPANSPGRDLTYN